MHTVPLLHLITGLGAGGAEAQLVRVAGGLAARGWPVIVAALDGRGPRAEALRAVGVPVHDLGMRGGLPDPLAVARLIRLIRRTRPGVLQSWLYHADLIGTLAAALTGVPHLWNLRCSDMDLRRYGLGTRLTVGALRFLCRRPLGIVVNSAAGIAAHAARGWKPGHWIPIPNGFDLDHWRPDPAARFVLRQRLGLDADTRLIAHVARADPMKDHAGFFAALLRLLPARPDLHAVLIGRGTEHLAPPPALLGRVHALGECGDVHHLLPGADLACLSSAFGEGFPNVLGEALACAVPCVATNVGDCAVIIGSAGTIVPPRDPGALAAALADLIDRAPAERARMGEIGRARVAAEFALPVVLDRYEQLYRAVQRAQRHTAEA